MTQSSAALLASLVLGIPLAGSLINMALGPHLGRRVVNLVGTLSILAAFIVSIVVFALILSAHGDAQSVTAHLWTWLDLSPAGPMIGVDVTLDPLSGLMLLVITGVGFLIHLYSVGYMEHDPDIARFFSYMNLFIFSMLVLVLAADLAILIIGWALVALSSYLLIGFWYERRSAVVAARKAFITQVVGDVALVIAAFLVVVNLVDDSGHHLMSLNLPTIFANAGHLASGGAVVTVICVLLAVGAFAKSAQVPLHTWLPDAMEGPTPVSALIHAATMVTAGVYLIARFHPLFDRAPIAQGVVACVGMLTALMAGIIALSQIDIKRVIAYSTMSQIGLMIYAVGIGAYSTGMYHFATHAIFKALLFLAAGNVIHALADEQDIRLMGGLASRMRRTEICFLSGSLALAGIPFFAGFFSKEALLGFGLSNGPGPAPWVLYVIGLVINILTGLYTFRLWGTVFRGEPQTARVYAAHEARAVMLGPVVILAVLSAATGIVVSIASILAGREWLAGIVSGFLEPVFRAPTSGVIAAEPGTLQAVLALIAGTACSLVGAGLALRLWYQRRPSAQAWAKRLPRVVPLLSYNKFYLDEIYDALLARPVAAIAAASRRVVEPRVMDGWGRGIATICTDFGELARGLQTGLIRDYASMFTIAAGIALFLAAVVLAR